MHNIFTWGKAVVCSGFLVVLLWSIPGAAQGQLISADYGAGDNRVDVTSRIQSLVRNGYLNVRITNDSMAVNDPARGHTKELRLRVREGNRIRDYNFRENTVVNLGLNVAESGRFGGRGRDRDYDGDDDDYSAPVVILQAWYGGGDRVANVSQRLRSLMVNGGIDVPINNQTMATDPAPDQRKALFVLYRYHGERRAAIIQENGELLIR